jgi:AraC-like DNA-binding protein
MSKARIFLALMYWSYFYALFSGFAINSNLVSSFPHLFRTGHAATLLFMPFSFLYVSRLMNPRKWKWFDTLHFLPLLIFLLDYADFFTRPGSEKLLLFQAASGTEAISDLAEGSFVPTGFHVAIRYSLMAIYCFAQFRLIRKAIPANKEQLAPNDAFMFRWLKWLTGTEIVFIVPPLLNLVISFEQVRVLNQSTGILVSFLQGYFLFFRPEILYGFSRKLPLVDVRKTNGFDVALRIIESTETKVEKITDSTNTLDSNKHEWVGVMINMLEVHLNDTKPYLQKGVSLHNLANELQCSPNKLSYAINQHFGMNFNALINKLRIEACCDKLKRYEFKDKTLEAIAMETGFRTRSTFIKAFKMQTGDTPSAYIREINGQSV